MIIRRHRDRRISETCIGYQEKYEELCMRWSKQQNHDMDQSWRLDYTTCSRVRGRNGFTRDSDLINAILVSIVLWNVLAGSDIYLG